MIVWRAMSIREFRKAFYGEEIRPPKGNLRSWKNRYTKEQGLCFFYNANNAAHWAMGKAAVIVCLDIPEKELEKGKGRYPDFQSHDRLRTIWVEECRVNSYQIGRNSKMLGYGILDLKARLIRMNGGVQDQPILPSYI